MGLANMDDDAPEKETAPAAPEKETAPATPARRGPRKASEVIAETEERVRAEMADELAAMRAQLEEAQAKAQAAESSLQEMKKVETAADQLKVDELTPVEPDEDGAVTVNFVSNDMTILGRSWFQGQELTIKPGTPEWDELYDHSRGKSYLQLTEDEQVLMWGERKFRPGHWQGMPLEALLDNPELSEEERAHLETILNKKKSRTAAPSGSTTPQKRSPVAYS